ncbi:uncharacterized protein I303_104398 [Kwoniella dejecticola CBS 10117]|uniref:Endoplasmic reticulum protein n=1 Tax=Kwoniella dejecticola CBS 10117 TaxID=1296121 RepID=A0A1A6A5G5_9TREE|nr:uncharacterized protein I303_04624 [Kwoniella dejecticola CBS 10117]OBR85290.1 hypothetical protein I303_04624 [Kwoniella dejecticola CBS 10117]
MPVEPPRTPSPLLPDPYDAAQDPEAARRRIKFYREMKRLHPDVEPPITWAETRQFIRSLLIFLGAPIIIPTSLIQHAITSPITISIVLKLLLLGFLFLASSIFSMLAVGAFFWSWKIGGNIEVEGWLYYGSKHHRPPHATVYFPLDKIEQDLRYDVQVELELVRPTKGTTDEMGNFMLSLELRALNQPERVLITAAQPSLPPAPLASPFISLPVLPTSNLPCIIPYPFRSLCPSRLLGYSVPTAKIRERRAKGGFSSRERGKDVVPLKKDLMEGVILKPGRLPEMTVGSGYVSIGREDLFEDRDSIGEKCKPPSREVKTTGWVLVRLTPRPTGIRWILASHPLPPLLLLPPISISITFSSSILAFTIISLVRNGNGKSKAKIENERKTIDGSDNKGPGAHQVHNPATGHGISDVRAQPKDRRREEWGELKSSLDGNLARSRRIEPTAGATNTEPVATPMTRDTSISSASTSTSLSGSDSAETVTPTRLRDRGHSVVGGSGGSSGSGSGSGNGSGSGSASGSGSSGTIRRRAKRNAAMGTTLALGASAGLSEADDNDTEMEVENEGASDVDDGAETEVEASARSTSISQRDWREFGREFGLNT